MRWAIAGFGEIADKAVAPAILKHQGSELAAICRRSEAELDKYGRKFGVADTYTDYRDMLEWGQFDAVYVATPVDLHAPQTLEALSRGFHVLVEKPMAMSAQEAESMVEAATARNLTLGIAYYHRLIPVNLRVREIVTSGEFGDLVALHGNASSLFSLPPTHPKYWRVNFAQSGGGPLVDVGTHRLDLFHALAGPAARVAGFANQRFVDGDVEDVCSLVVEYTSGVQATLSSLWCVSPGRGDYEVMCTQGRIQVPDIRGQRIVIQSGDGERELVVPPDELHDLPLIERFVDAAEGRSELELSGVAGLEVQRITDAVYKSAASGTMIHL